MDQATTSIHHTVIIPASVADVYAAYTDPVLHSEVTGAEATGEPVVGGEFTAWDGYIVGEYLELEPNRRVVQHWSTSEWPDGYGPSTLELIFDEAEDGATTVTMNHTDVPKEQSDDYDQGWYDNYWDPMIAYFQAKSA